MKVANVKVKVANVKVRTLVVIFNSAKKDAHIFVFSSKISRRRNGAQGK